MYFFMKNESIIFFLPHTLPKKGTRAEGVAILDEQLCNRAWPRRQQAVDGKQFIGILSPSHTQDQQLGHPSWPLQPPLSPTNLPFPLI